MYWDLIVTNSFFLQTKVLNQKETWERKKKTTNSDSYGEH